MKFSRTAVALLVLGALSAQHAHATNGMNLSGYGPEAHAMGGASMAYDNGTAAVMNNPATLGLMQEGSRFDAALGGLFPDITAKTPTMADAKSNATAFYMPAVGWVNKSGQMTYGIGLFSQGGMGTEYSQNSFMGAFQKPVRSEVGVGRVIVPLAYQADNLTVGGSIDYVWAGMDLQMMMDAATMNGMMTAGLLTATGGATAGLGSFIGGGASNYGYFNFSDNSAFTGKAKGTGFAAKLGVTYRFNKQMTVGATYHSQTKLSDLSASGASMSMIDNTNALGGGAGTEYVLNGNIKVLNFQWPETYGIGMAYQATDNLMLVADYKRIGWAKVMKNFRVTFSSADMGGLDLAVTMPQDWVDQNVYQLGAAYKMNSTLTLRGGLNIANNPVPDSEMNPMFPAIAKTNISGGLGYMMNKQSSIDVSFAYVPKTTATNTSGAAPVTVDFGGTSGQFLYSYRY
jgi:long-chain fatty acid transport protein